MTTLSFLNNSELFATETKTQLTDSTTDSKNVLSKLLWMNWIWQMQNMRMNLKMTRIHLSVTAAAVIAVNAGMNVRVAVSARKSISLLRLATR